MSLTDQSPEIYREQAQAWMKVHDALTAIRPGWYTGAGTATEKAIALIQELAGDHHHHIGRTKT